jgi:transcriptional regulator with XRE-family HTH domain
MVDRRTNGDHESKVYAPLKVIFSDGAPGQPNVRAMKKEQEAFAARLRAGLKAAGVEASPKQLEMLLARYGGTPVTPQAISGWLNGRHLPKPDNIQALARMVNMPPHELQFGPRSRGVREARAAWPDHLSGIDRLTFEEFLLLPERRRKLVRELIAAFTEASTRDKGVQ